jgi:fructan beta-fructosidase
LQTDVGQHQHDSLKFIFPAKTAIITTMTQAAEKPVNEPGAVPPLEAEFTVKEKYLILPIENAQDATQANFTLFVDGEAARQGKVPLAASAESTDWHAFYTIDAYRGRPARITMDSTTPEAFSLIHQADSIPGEDQFYTETHRPQFHFTQKVGWINDPNGMVYHNGTWHLFFQHNPVSRKWGNMTWGHATSKDLIHWKQHPNKLHDRISAKGACFSGGATVDKYNTAGFGENTLIAFFTDTMSGECMAYSPDGGVTLVPYADNPVIFSTVHEVPDNVSKPGHRGRDPKVIWYAYDEQDTPLNDKARQLGGHWVMAVYVWHADEVDQQQDKRSKGHYIAFYTSGDLKHWEFQSELEGYFECPELFELPVDGDPGNTRWVVHAADARYAIGQFDGKTFTPDHQGKFQLHYGPFYASQTFDNAPDDRRIQIGWLRIETPDGPYNQHFSFPYRLTLNHSGEAIRMRANPIEEIKQLRDKSHNLGSMELPSDKVISTPVTSDLLDVTAVFDMGDANRITLKLPGRTVQYDAVKQELNGAPLEPMAGKISVRVLADRLLTEIFGNDGAVCVVESGDHQTKERIVSISAEGGKATLLNLEAHEMRPIWNPRHAEIKTKEVDQ